MTVLEVLSDETKWTQGAVARDENGILVQADDPRAVCWCLGGAIRLAYGSVDRVTVVWAFIEREIGCSPVIWSDDEDRTYADVRALVERLKI